MFDYFKYLYIKKRTRDVIERQVKVIEFLNGIRMVNRPITKWQSEAREGAYEVLQRYILNGHAEEVERWILENKYPSARLSLFRQLSSLSGDECVSATLAIERLRNNKTFMKEISGDSAEYALS